MSEEQIIESVLSTVAESDPPIEVPEGLWCFTDEEVRSMLRQAVEMAREHEGRR